MRQFRTLLGSAVVLISACAGPSSASPEATARFDASDWDVLFDGRTLEGWTTTGGRYDGAAIWGVEDGAIVGREGPGGEGGLLYAATDRHSFLFTVEVKLDHPFDSGVFLRMAPRGQGVQITLDDRDGGEIGAVYADKFLERRPEGAALWRKNEWNRVEVRCVGIDYRVTAWLNGVLATDYRLPAGTPGQAPTGMIGLQVHGAMKNAPHLAARFRDVRVRELPVFDATLFDCDERGRMTPTKAGSDAGWRPLFDGGDLGAFEAGGAKAGALVEDGALVFRGSENGDLRTKEDFSDFELALDFQPQRMANSGVFLRSTRGEEAASFSGCEIQILDDFNYEAVERRRLRSYQFTGGLYGSRAPDVRALKPLGSWNTYRIAYRGSRLSVELNGRTLHDAVDTFTLPGEPPFKDRARSGFIGLQRHAPPSAGDGAYIRFRNIFVRPLRTS